LVHRHRKLGMRLPPGGDMEEYELPDRTASVSNYPLTVLLFADINQIQQWRKGTLHRRWYTGMAPRRYDVIATEVPIVFNFEGDHDHNGMIFALKKTSGSWTKFAPISTSTPINRTNRTS
jgi:hypothetical protein